MKTSRLDKNNEQELRDRNVVEVPDGGHHLLPPVYPRASITSYPHYFQIATSGTKNSPLAWFARITGLSAEPVHPGGISKNEFSSFYDDEGQHLLKYKRVLLSNWRDVEGKLYQMHVTTRYGAEMFGASCEAEFPLVVVPKLFAPTHSAVAILITSPDNQEELVQKGADLWAWSRWMTDIAEVVRLRPV